MKKIIKYILLALIVILVIMLIIVGIGIYEAHSLPIQLCQKLAGGDWAC